MTHAPFLYRSVEKRATPVPVRMLAARAQAQRRLLHPPGADLIIHAHITLAPAFDPWTTEGDTAFRNRSAT